MAMLSRFKQTWQHNKLGFLVGLLTLLLAAALIYFLIRLSDVL
ncbi:MAG: hypothetical protein ACOX0F_02485 [Syntrophomonadaceae bacterium]